MPRLGGAFEAIDVMKCRLVQSQAERRRLIEAGELKVIGVNSFTESEPSPLEGEGPIQTARRGGRAEACGPTSRSGGRSATADAVDKAVDELRRVASSDENIMPATIALAHAGGTTGEWANALREVFGEFRAPTGVAGAVGGRGVSMDEVRERTGAMVGGPPRMLVAKPGLDGHSNGAEQVAVAARDAGFEVVYQGIRLTPGQIAAAARDEDVDIIGLSILSGSHLELVPEVVRLVRAAGVDAPIVVGGIIPSEDQIRLKEAGVAACYTPKDYELAQIMGDMAELASAHRAN